MEDDLRFLIIDTLLRNAQFSKDDGVSKLINTAKLIYDFVRFYEGSQTVSDDSVMKDSNL